MPKRHQHVPPPAPPSGEAEAASPDERYMARAVSLARLGWGQVSPNPMVGAVIVREGEVVGEGAHRRFGEAHAEIEALRGAGERTRGATLYVTLEPCAHTGKTPPCVDAIVAAGVTRVVMATRDPNPAATGGVERLRVAGITVVEGPGAEAATEMNAAYFHSFRARRPWITLKLATSLDSAIADSTRAPGWLSGPEARRKVHELRAGHDAIAVGMGTVLVDDPLLTVRFADPPRVAPLRVVLSRSGRLPLTARLAQRAQEAPVLVFASAPDPNYDHALRELGVEVVTATSLDDVFRTLAARGVRSVLVEGGAAIAGELIAAGLVDRMVLFQAPVLLGRNALGAFSEVPSAGPDSGLRWRTIAEERFGPDRMVVLAPERA